MNESEPVVALSEAEIKHQRRLAQYRKHYNSHKEQAREYYRKNKDKFAKRCVEYRKKNPERHRENARRQYAKNPAARIASTVKSQKKHAAKRAAYMLAWRAKNKEHLLRYYHEKRVTPEWKIRAIQAHHKRTALKNKCEVRATKTDLKKFLESATHCHYCGTNKAKLTVDHFVPLSKGGAHALENFVPACKSCNSSKRDRDPHEFMRSIGRLL